MSKITPDEVRRLATLSNIGLDDKEVEELTGELDRIVGFVEKLSSVDIKGVEPTDQVTGLVDVWREDVVAPGLSHEQLKLNAPEWQDNQFKVRRVL